MVRGVGFEPRFTGTHKRLRKLAPELSLDHWELFSTQFRRTRLSHRCEDPDEGGTVDRPNLFKPLLES